MSASRSRFALALVVLYALAGCQNPDGNGGQIGRPDPVAEQRRLGVWAVMPYQVVHDPIGAMLLHSDLPEDPQGPIGKILLISGSGDDIANQDYESTVLDLSTSTLQDVPMDFDAFCVGFAQMADGNPLLVGGTIYDPNDSPNQELGLPTTEIFDIATSTFVPQPPMANGRWYPTVTELADGRMMVDTGWDQIAMNSTVEIFTAGVGWSPEYPNGWDTPFYMRQHVLPDGRVFYGAPETESRYFAPATAGKRNSGWTHAAWTNYGKQPNQYDREYGSSVLLGLDPDDDYRPKVVIMGGNRTNPTDTTEIIDLSDADPQWKWGPKLDKPRVRMSETLLPDGHVLVVGGATVDLATTTAVLSTEIYNPDTNKLSSSGNITYPRLDHHEVLVLPDATVWVAGNQGPVGTPVWETHMELYQPPYLFDDQGNLAPRPTILDAPDQVTYGSSFSIQVDDDIGTALLLKLGAMTHSFNTDQRLIWLDHASAPDGSFTLTAPPNANLAPPGYYMLFVTNGDGVPSIAKYVQVH